MSPLKKLMAFLAGNKHGQKFLENRIRKLSELMGVGAGGDVRESGELAVVHKMATLLSPPYCIFDVGANKGKYLDLLTSRIQATQYQIHCFEPSKPAFDILSARAQGNPNIVVNNIGFGKEPGELTLYYNEPGSEIASLTKRRLEHFNIDFSQSESVRIETLDNYCRENNIYNIDLLKVDVEGHELNVLQSGSKAMFKKNAIKMISFEFGGCNIDTRTFFQDFFYFFRDVNMALFRITPSGYCYPIKGYSEVLEQFRTTNFLAVHNILTI